MAETAKSMFVNFPVKDLQKSMEFFTAVGFEFNPNFTDDKATCMVIGENINAMLLVEEYFKTFTNKEISDASKTTEVLIALMVESREKVDKLVNSAVEAGGNIAKDTQDLGFMYQRSFLDLDGHQWEIGFMDESAIPQG
ncbi:VOC family protein [Paenibacillus glycanilyticus]|uniref:VOC family protein n=1 Tax=Paenibacillus glycanilyticus TaxID=126569 RepID=UPI00203F316E|nr:VOC family protein [Paenibacillus glycanilyticus]MCM3629811.1 VOC family protein [Paenibacillus glycanilyticus]